MLKGPVNLALDTGSSRFKGSPKIINRLIEQITTRADGSKLPTTRLGNPPQPRHIQLREHDLPFVEQRLAAIFALAHRNLCADGPCRVADPDRVSADPLVFECIPGGLDSAAFMVLTVGEEKDDLSSLLR